MRNVFPVKYKRTVKDREDEIIKKEVEYQRIKEYIATELANYHLCNIVEEENFGLLSLWDFSPEDWIDTPEQKTFIIYEILKSFHPSIAVINNKYELSYIKTCLVYAKDKQEKKRLFVLKELKYI